MAEESLVAELRLGYQQFQQDLQRAQQTAQQQSRSIAGALGQINNSVKDLPNSFKKFNDELKQTEQATAAATKGASGFAGVMQSLKGTLGALGLYNLIGEVKEFATEMIKGGEATLSLEAQLRVATGSIQGSAQAMAFAAGEAKRLGQDTIAAQKSFSQIAAATRDTALAGQGAETIFTGFANAVTAAGKSGDDFQRVLNQVVQGLNKNKVQQEDIQVLAENGIAAQKILAESLGITGEKLAEAMQKGQVSGEAFLLLGARLTELNEEIAEQAANRLPGAFRRGLTEIKDEFRDLFAAIFESQELTNTLGPLFKGADLFPSRSEMTQAIDNFARHLAVLIDISKIIGNEMKKVFVTELKEAGKLIADVFSSLGRIPEIISKTNIPLPPAIKDLAAGIVAATGSLDEFFTELEARVSDMKPIQILGELGDPSTSLGGLKKIRSALEQAYDIEGLGAFDPAETEQAAVKSGEAAGEGLAKGVQKTKDKILKGIFAPSDEEIEKREKAEADYAEKSIEFLKENLEKAAKLREEKLKEEQDAALAAIKARINAERKLQEDAAHARSTIDKMKKDLEPAPAKTAGEQQEEILKNMRENIQNELGDILTDIFSGQLDSIQSVADNIVKIFARMASEMIVAMQIQPLLESVMKDLTTQIKETLAGIDVPIPGGGSVSGGKVAKGAAGVAAGIGVGFGVADMLGGGMLGNTIGGAIGGAIAGAVIGSLVPGFAPLGAAIGGAVGALGGFMSALLDAEEKVRIAPLTSAAPPTGNVEAGSVRRGPFGFISLVDQSSTTGGDTNTVTALIAEADAAIAALMTKAMRETVAQALQGQHFALDAREMDDAIAQTIQTRLFIALRALTNEATAVNIVGEPYTGTSENIEMLQQRALDALSIIKTIEEFKIGEMGDVAMQIHKVQEAYAALISRAQELGLDQQVGELQAQEQQELTAITTDFNTGIRDQILGFIDPAQQAAEELARLQEKIWHDAVAAGADLAQVQQLFTLQWQEHTKRFGTSAEQTANAIANLTEEINEFGRGGTSSTKQYLDDLTAKFNILAEEANRLGFGVEGLTEAYHQQYNAAVQAAQNDVIGMILGFVDPLAAAMLGIQIQAEELQQLVDEGLIDKSLLDQWRALAEEEAKYADALRTATGATRNSREALAELGGTFIDTGLEIDLSPVDKALQDLYEQWQRLREAYLRMGWDTAGLDASYNAQVAEIMKDEAERIREENSRIVADIVRAWQEAKAANDRVAQERQAAIDSMDQFTQGGMSGPGQQLVGLTTTYNALAEEANRLDLATDTLTQSYHEQYNAVIQLAQADVVGMILGLTDPLAAAMHQIAQQAKALEQLVADGIIDQSLADLWQDLAEEEALAAEAIRIATGAARNAVESLAGMGGDFIDAGLELDLTPVEKALKDLYDQWQMIREAYLRMNWDVSGIDASYQAQVDQINADEAERQRQHNADMVQGVSDYWDGIREANERAAQEQEDAILAIDQFIASTLSGPGQQLESLRLRFEDLEAEAIRLGISTDGLTRSYKEQEDAIRQSAINDILGQTLGILDPFAAAMLQIQIQGEEFLKMVREGIISEDMYNTWRSTMEENAKYNEALRLATGGTSGSLESLNRVVQDFVTAGIDMSAAERRILEIQAQFDQLAAAFAFLKWDTTEIEAARDRQIQLVREEEAERQRQEAQRRREQAQREREQRAAEAKRAREQRAAEAKRRREEREAAIKSIEQFRRATMSGPGKEIESLRDQFKELREEARRLNIGTKQLTASFNVQLKELKRQAKEQLTEAINALTNPLASAYTQINNEAREFRKMQREGLLRRRDVDRWQRLATEEAKFTEANRLAGGGQGDSAKKEFNEMIQSFIAAGKPMSDLGQELKDLHHSTFGLQLGLVSLKRSVKGVVTSLTQQHLDILKEAHSRVQEVIDSLGLPFGGAMRAAQEQIDGLQQMVKDKLVPKSYVDYAVRLIKADSLVQEALRRISNAPVNSIEQLAEAFDEFIQAGDPRSSVGQQLYDLTENFINLADAAHLLGYSTTELEASYLAQSKVIREDLMKDIEDQLSAQIDAIKSIDDYINSLKVAEEQPINLRFDEAQKQFREAMAGDDISKMLDAAETLRDVAQKNFGSGEDFFAVETQVVSALKEIQAREQAIVEAERQRLTAQAEREIKGLQIGQSSLDQLQRVAHFGSESARALDELTILARVSSQREQETINLLSRVLIEGRR